VISVALERPCGFLNRHEQFPTVLIISSSRDSYFLTMVGRVNRLNEIRSATTTEKETLIFPEKCPEKKSKHFFFHGLFR
jgi:hypothetical protein